MGTIGSIITEETVTSTGSVGGNTQAWSCLGVAQSAGKLPSGYTGVSYCTPGSSGTPYSGTYACSTPASGSFPYDNGAGSGTINYNNLCSNGTIQSPYPQYLGCQIQSGNNVAYCNIIPPCAISGTCNGGGPGSITPGNFTVNTPSYAGGAVSLSWSASSNATQYTINRTASGQTTLTFTATGTSFTDREGLVSGVTYSYQVNALSSTGNGTAASPVTITIPSDNTAIIWLAVIIILAVVIVAGVIFAKLRNRKNRKQEAALKKEKAKDKAESGGEEPEETETEVDVAEKED